MVLFPSGVVLVLVVWVEFYMLAYREKAAGIESRGAPFDELALVERFDGDVRNVAEGTYGDRPLDRQFVAIAPGEISVSPVEVGAVAVGDAESGFHGKVESRGRDHPIFGGSVRFPNVAISGFQHQKPRLRIVQVESSHCLK